MALFLVGVPAVIFLMGGVDDMHEVVCAYRSTELSYFKNVNVFLHGSSPGKLT